MKSFGIASIKKSYFFIFKFRQCRYIYFLLPILVKIVRVMVYFKSAAILDVDRRTVKIYVIFK